VFLALFGLCLTHVSILSNVVSWTILTWSIKWLWDGVGVIVKKVFMWASVLFHVSCDAIERGGLRLKPTQAQSSLGREGKAPSTCRRQVSSCRPSSPFSLSMRRSHAKEPTNNETLRRDAARNQHRAGASGPPRPLPILAFCGGAAIKAIYTSKQHSGRNQR